MALRSEGTARVALRAEQGAERYERCALGAEGHLQIVRKPA